MADAQQGPGRVLVVAEDAEGDGPAGLAAALGPALTPVRATLGQAARDDADTPVLCLRPAPEVAVARALARGATLEAALEGWRAEAAALLGELRPLRRRLTLVLTGALPPAPEALAAVLWPRLGHVPEPVPEPVPESVAEPVPDSVGQDHGVRLPEADGPKPSDDPRALLTLIAAAGLAADPEARALLAEIGATAVPLPHDAALARATQALAELRAIMADGGAKADLGRQIAAMAAEIAQLDTALGAAQETARHGAAEAARASADATAAQHQVTQLTAAVDATRAELAQARAERDNARAERDDARADVEAEAAARAREADRLGTLEADRARAQAARASAEEAAAAALAQAEALRSDLARHTREGAQRGWRDAVLGHEILRLSRTVRTRQAGADPGPDGGGASGPAPDDTASAEAAARAVPAASAAAARHKRPAAPRKTAEAERKRGGDSRG